ncbi:2-phosphosulfolactate phosphatase [Actinoplanes friuliensis DSM 7358]|uniref:Probable 2-phosphosulfolactate phosphatase n=1 Tax=Actinoplanes friuliensis DSM 7358 TaxID=1246995 RepID=U5W5Y8_9ACTN|nr:2-phosphosulfolactate phosphatase [Actinoplanes friuliensis DSM 7358]
MNEAWTQRDSRIRFEWGPTGAGAVAVGAAFVAVVDVLSFTTTLSVAVDLGISVLPYRWRDGSAARVAAEQDAVLAVGRREVVAPGQVSLSPATLRGVSGVERLVLPSPNGATVAAGLAEGGARLVGVSLRNAEAAARWVARQVGADDVVAVVAAGERWPDRSLRPAVEDLWGAGAFISALVGAGLRGHSIEAGAAVCAYESVAGSVPTALGDCASGRELIAHGFPEDVASASEVGSASAVPVLSDGWFVAASDG